MVNPLPPTGPVLPAAVTSTPPADTPSTWRVGQILAATVVAKPQPGQTELRIGSLPVRAQTGTLELSPGQNLRLEVASLKEQPVLKLLGLLQANPTTLALRDVLPRQQPLTPLLAALARLAAGPAQTPPLPPTVLRVVRDVFERLPDAASVATASGLRQALRDSGLFLESKLSRSAVPASQTSSGQSQAASPTVDTARDFKANLLRLVGALREHAANSAPAARQPTTSMPGTAGGPPTTVPAPPLAQSRAGGEPTTPATALTDPGAPLQRGQAPLPPVNAARLQGEQALALTTRELQHQAEGALARVQLNQLSSLPQERPAGMEWLVELPVRRDQETDVWNLRIVRDRERAADGDQADAGGGWTVMLAFDLPGIGPMQTRVNLRGEHVTAQFFSHTPGTLALVHQHLPLLEARLRQAGLCIAEVSCNPGALPAPVAPSRTRLLDERV